MQDEDYIQSFYKNYREGLSRQYENAQRQLEQKRRNAQQSLMSSANKSGMLYSNFPERSKIRYDVGTYMPAQTKLFNTYQTGLDSIRNNIINYQNSIAEIQDSIANLNSMQ